MTRIIFRFDDYGLLAGREEARHLRHFRKLQDLFHRLEIPYTTGVIPEYAGDVHRSDETETRLLSERPERMDVLKQIDQSEFGTVALHGVTHRRRSLWNRSEFVGRSRSNQRQILRRGMNRLAEWIDWEPDVFIPPWNHLDRTTVSVLESLGFDVVSAGLPVHKLICKNSSLRSYPQCITPGHIKSQIQSLAPVLPLLVVVLHGYEFEELAGKQGVTSVDSLRKVLEWISGHSDLEAVSITDQSLPTADKDFGYRVLLTKLLRYDLGRQDIQLVNRSVPLLRQFEPLVPSTLLGTGLRMLHRRLSPQA